MSLPLNFVHIFVYIGGELNSLLGYFINVNFKDFKWNFMLNDVGLYKYLIYRLGTTIKLKLVIAYLKKQIFLCFDIVLR